MFGARTADGIYLNNPINNNTLFGNDDPVRDHVTVYPSGNYFTTYYYQNTHLDLMVSVMRLIYGGVTEKDHWDLIPSVGMGYMTIFPSKGTPVNHLFTSNFGLQGKYRIDNEWSVNLNLQYALFSADFDSRYVGKKYAGNLNLSAGVTYNIFGQHFKKQVRGTSMPNIIYKEVIKMVHDTIVQQQIITVNDTIYLTETMDVPMPKSRIDTVFLNTTPQTIDFVNAALGYILFNIGSDKPSESVTLQCINTAHYLNENPGQTITLYG